MSYPTVSVAATGFLLSKAALGRSQNTLNDYRITLERFYEHLGDPPIDQVTPKHIEQFFLWLQRDYTYDPTRVGKAERRSLKPKTVVNTRSTLIHFWRWVEDEFSIPSPCRIDQIKFQEEPIVPLTEDELKQLLSACDTSHVTTGEKTYKMKRPTRLRDRAIILTLYDTGVRVSELCNMRFKDIDLTNSRIRVTGKGKKDRYIYVGKYCAQALWKYQASRFPNVKPEKEEFVFVDQDGMKQVTRHAVRQLLGRIGDRAGIPDCHPHRFRHSFACAYLRNGGDPFSLQDLLGHTTMTMTSKYVNMVRADVQEMHKRASPGDHLLR